MCDSLENPSSLTSHASLTPELTPTAPVGMRIAARPLPVVDIEAATSAPLQLGAIKELLQRFIRARQDAPVEQTEMELRELYSFLCRQAQNAGMDPARLIESYQADAAKRQPKPVRP